ncbi:MMPL family transporter [Hujiaoplasma nucleasis]|uniref:MMPL family transporter n=1 Tax=Hujiaoplasma nucleasis TaxID=2725268 RepID=A0A7L6N1U5_9MOLU|nr:MMPL family transporter [Hujiaoplasma nucleasis]QLY40230.1 MMPL family transporter [Hujiaoplasma nucleasis]
MKILIKNNARWYILVLTFVILIVSVILSFQIKTNYDMTEYLPKDSETRKGLLVLEDTFGNHASIELMIKDVSIGEAYEIKEDVLSVEGVLDVVWLDNYGDIVNHEDIDPLIKNNFYQGDNALMTLVFIEDAYHLDVEDSIIEIRQLLVDEDIYMRGEALNNIESRSIAQAEVYKIILIILPICFVILLFASKSWLEPLIVLFVLGIGVIVNLGTNALLPNISFITLTIASALQLAISLDYSLFFIHRYYELRDEGYEVLEAVNKAFKKSLPVITASAVTTMVGFLALLMMRYRIGLDIGLVLSKGIFLSYLSVIIILPAIIVVFNSLIDRFRHRHLMFHLGGFSKYLIRFRYIFLFLFLVLLSFGLIFQSKTDFLYGSSSYAGQESLVSKDKNEIREYFPEYQSLTILLKDSSKEQELALIAALSENDHVEKIDALYTVIDPMTPENMIPEPIKYQYVQNSFTRITLWTDILEENDSMFVFNDYVNKQVDLNYDEYYILGLISSTGEIKDTVLADTPIVMLVSVILIGIVLFLIFRKLWIPFILILVIEAAIWFNMSLLVMNDRQVIYIGYLVVMSLQLGATIDYAVLYASRYMENRQNMNKGESMAMALRKTSIPIMISGIVLASAGFTEMLFSHIEVVSDIGLLIGRGALLSLGFVLLFLPILLYLLDSIIINTNKG